MTQDEMDAAFALVWLVIICAIVVVFGGNTDDRRDR